ncbi:MAG: ADP-ribosylation factor-like protein [Promethearchaeota archaeon]
MAIFSRTTQTSSHVKIAFVGYAAVGKTSLINLLLEKAPQLEYKPTIGLDFGQRLIKSILGEHELSLWDFGGQRNFWPAWNSYLLGTKLCVVVTDSTPTGVLRTRMIIDWLNTRDGNGGEDNNTKEDNGGDDMKIIAIANKQDLEEAMNPERVENVLHVTTYPMVAIDPQYREKLLQLISTEIKSMIEE